MSTAISFIKRNYVALIAWTLAVVSMIIVPPDAKYLDYFEWKAIACLFSMMLVIGAFKSVKFFVITAQTLIRKLHNARLLCLALVFITFIGSIFIANDMALLTFLPLTFMVFKECAREKYVAFTVIMQTVAANLGGMIMPFGNPQSLYIYANYHVSVGDFVTTMAPPFAISLVAISALCFFVKSEHVDVTHLPTLPPNKIELCKYLLLAVLSLLAVFRVIDYIVATVAIAVCLLIINRRAFKFVDSSLLMTFLAFFIFANNMSRIGQVSEVVGNLLQKNTLLTGVISCQLFSNVPSAIFLSQFTSNYKPLLLAVNIGGCGTLIASLASLISLKAYNDTYPRQTLKYVLRFSLINFGFLIPLTAMCYFIS